MIYDYNIANMEDVLDEIVSTEDLKVGENYLWFGKYVQIHWKSCHSGIWFGYGNFEMHYVS